MPEESIIRKVIKNEIAQVAGVIGFVWFFVISVILPINNIQNSLANIQLSLVELKSNGAGLDTRITLNSNDIIKLQERMTRYNLK